VKLVHLADLHIGFRQFTRSTPEGRNVREMDVTSTLHTLVDRMIAIAPDVIVIAGDVFHSVRPSNGTVVDAFAEFSRLMQALPTAVVVMVAGNHDVPRSADTGCILRLFASLGIHVIERDATRLAFPALNLSVLAVPDAPQTVRPAFDPDLTARYNVICLHGEVQGMTTRWVAPERAAVEIPIADLQLGDWTYVALGHYHVFRQLAPNMNYSGSIDYTSTNPWGERDEEIEAGLAGKGFIERDLDTGEQTFHPLAPSRRYIDLPRFSAHEMSIVDVDEAIREAVDSCEGGIDGQVVRLVVTDAAPGMVRELDHKAIRSYKGRALNFHLNVRTARAIQFGSSLSPIVRRQSLDEVVGEFFAKREWPADITRDQMLALANTYLGDATALDQPSAPLHEEEPALVAADSEAA
jgi:DNA repair exonuclease SbcCD nuclease subunit